MAMLINRRELIARGSAGLAGIIAAGRAPAEVVRSMLSVRQVMTIGSSEWQNPYVTDGLVAMWDGEWNAGGGRYDEETTVWKDLVGNNDLDVLANGCWDNAFICSGSGVLAKKTNAGISQCKTLEVVFKDAKGVVSSDYKTRVIVSIHSNNYIQKGLWVRRYNGMLGTGYKSKGFQTSLTTSIECFGFDFDKNQGYKNGVWRTAVNTGTKPLANSNEITVGGSPGNNSNYSWSGTVYCIRVYDRSLSDEEIQKNYMIDKERFGLE